MKHTSGSTEPATTELQNVVFAFGLPTVLFRVSTNESGLASVPIKDPILCLGLQADTRR